MAVVYLHRKESDNSIYYVGIGNNTGRSKEIRGRSEYWRRVFNKYGRKIDIIASNIPIEDAKELEMFLIQEIGIDNLCNHTLGGEGFFGGKHTEATKMKIRKANTGRKASKETREKLSAAMMGHPNYLKSQSKEARIKIGNANRGSLNSNAKKVVNSITSIEYGSLVEACRELQLPYQKVSAHISGATVVNKYQHLIYI